MSLLLSALALVSLSQAKEIESDGRLAPTIAIRHEIISLADFAREISAHSRVPLQVAAPSGDRKITIAFHGRPMWEGLQKVAEAMPDGMASIRERRIYIRPNC